MNETREGIAKMPPAGGAGALPPVFSPDALAARGALEEDDEVVLLEDA